MVRTMRRPAAPTRPPEPSAGPLQRVEGLAGAAILCLTATTLGLPLSGGHLAIDLLLVILGYKMTISLRLGQNEDRNVMRFWLGHVGRIGIPLLVALGLTITYWSWTGVAADSQRQAVIGALTPDLTATTAAGNGHLAAVGQ